MKAILCVIGCLLIIFFALPSKSSSQAMYDEQAGIEFTAQDVHIKRPTMIENYMSKLGKSLFYLDKLNKQQAKASEQEH